MSDRFLYILAAVFLLLSLAGVLRHELWLDEAHHFLIARDSSNINELWNATRPDGHPVLWNFLLFIITRFTIEVAAMQVFHVLISTAAVLIFVKNAPFSLLFKTLFVFGYFMFFEYNLLSRNYAIGVLLLFAACSIYCKKQHLALFSIVLGLAANVHLMFAVVAISLFITRLIDNTKTNSDRENRAFGIALFGFALILLTVQLATTSAGWFFESQSTDLTERLSKGFVSMLKGVIAIPDFTMQHWWNSNMLVNISKPVSTVVAILLFGLPLLLFRNFATLVFVYLAIFGTLIFFFVTQRGAARFYGLTFMILIVGLWLELAGTERARRFRFSNVRYRNHIVFFVLIIHFVSGVTAYALDFAKPFHNGKAAVEFADKNFPDIPIVSFTCDATVLSAYAKEKIWFGCQNRYASFCDWQSPCDPMANSSDARLALIRFAKQQPRGIYISYLSPMTKTAGWQQLDQNTQARFLAAFDSGAILKDKFYVWEVKRKP